MLYVVLVSYFEDYNIIVEKQSIHQLMIIIAWRILGPVESSAAYSKLGHS